MEKTKIYTAADWKSAWDEASRLEDDEALQLLAKHHFHADHCLGYEVLAWPCPEIVKVLDKLLS